MLDRICTKANFMVNAGLAFVLFLVWIIFLGYNLGDALISALLFFVLMFGFDFIVELFRNRA